MKKAASNATVAVAPSQPTPAPAPALKKVNLAGFATQSTASKGSKTYPLLPDPEGQIAELVSGILEKSAQVEALEGALELDKAELIASTKPFYFTRYHGQTAVDSSIEARSKEGQPVRVVMANLYRGTSDEAGLTRIAGEHAERLFKQSFELKIKGDEIPEDNANELLGELQELFARHGASKALTAKATIKPTKEFHTARHTLFSVEENHELDKILPIGASVKTKLGKSGGADE